MSDRAAGEASTTALKAKPESTAAEVASAAGIGRSTASKVLARLASSGQLRRTEGGRDGARRLPDRFTLVSSESPTKTAKPKAVAGTHPKVVEDRLKPGQLDGLVLAYLKKNTRNAPHGPIFEKPSSSFSSSPYSWP